MVLLFFFVYSKTWKNFDAEATEGKQICCRHTHTRMIRYPISSGIIYFIIYLLKWKRRKEKNKLLLLQRNSDRLPSAILISFCTYVTPFVCVCVCVCVYLIFCSAHPWGSGERKRSRESEKAHLLGKVISRGLGKGSEKRRDSSRHYCRHRRRCRRRRCISLTSQNRTCCYSYT